MWATLRMRAQWDAPKGHFGIPTCWSYFVSFILVLLFLGIVETRGDDGSAAHLQQPTGEVVVSLPVWFRESTNRISSIVSQDTWGCFKKYDPCPATRAYLSCMCLRIAGDVLVRRADGTTGNWYYSCVAGFGRMGLFRNPEPFSELSLGFAF